VKDAQTAVLFDKDSTLFRTGHRWHLAPTKDPSSDWHKYAQACLDDEPVYGVIRAAALHARHHQVHICSGAFDSALVQVTAQLAKHGVQYDYLALRRTGDERPGGAIKAEYAMRLESQGIEVLLAYEDWEPDARELEAVGVPVIGVNPFYPQDKFGAI
jgi:hypothetical protein